MCAFTILVTFTFFYVILIVFLSYGFKHLKTFIPISQYPFVSIVLPVRNEEKHLSACLTSLLNQGYPQNLYEIIVVDDLSTDHTVKIAQKFCDKYNNVSLVFMQHQGKISPKKAALQFGISKAKGEFIFTTDADCIVPHDWINQFIGYFDSGTALVASWLLIENNRSFLSKVEALDSLSYVAIGASAFYFNRPFLANGANLAFRKSVFEQVNGYKGAEKYGSGDDDLLVQKINSLPEWKCRFIIDQRAAVVTGVNHSLKTFLSQRCRWASKAFLYPRGILFLMMIIYLFFVFLGLSTLYAIIFAKALCALPVFIKISIDSVFIKSVLNKLGKKDNLFYIIIADIIQLFYIIFAGVWGLFGNYSWKGRVYSKGQLTCQKRI